jgi:hypothetical protein
MSGYTRQSVSQIQDGQVVNAAPVNAEFDTIQTAFSSVSGHKHDGTPSEGAPITTIGPTQNVSATATELYPRVDNYLSLGTAALQFKDLYLKGTAHLSNTAITGTFSVTGATTLGSTLGVTGNTTVGGTLTATGALTASTSLTTPTVIAGVSTNGYVFTGLGSGLRSPTAGTVEVYTASGNKVAISPTNVTVTGNLVAQNTLTATGAISAASTLAVTGATTLTGAAALNGGLTTTTASTTGNVTIGGTLGVTGNTTVGGTLGVTGASTFTGEVTATNGIESGFGSAATPAYSFSTDADTGIYRPAANQVGISTGGTLRANVSNVSVETSVPVLLPDGSLSNPSLSFSSDQNTGIARFGTDSMSFVTGGATSVAVDTGGLTLANGRYIRFTDNTFFKFDSSVGVVPSAVASVTSTSTQIIVTVPQENPTMFWLWPSVTNTGSVTMQINGGGAEAVRTPTEGVLPAGYLSYDTITFPLLMIKSGAGTWYAFKQFESGTNGDGYWARYPNGTQICTQTVSVGDITTAIGSLFQSSLQTWTFPKPFVTTTFLSVTGGVESASGRYFGMNGISTSASTYRSVGPVSSATASNVRLMAVGRWFS